MHQFSIYNTLTQAVERFVPCASGEIKIYVCGITVYDLCHIGHARVFVVFDSLVRYWQSLGWKVRFVRNITDIDDKIIAKAQKEAQSLETITHTYIEAMQADMQALGVLAPTVEPKATHTIDTMIQCIERLLAKGVAYLAENGDVYFSVAQYQGYGALSHQDLEQLRTGARVESSLYKRDPLDFVLWKKAKTGEPAWSAPFGEGRPGWHIECSAMSLLHLGETIDIHGGGHDLQFPHHENERAQSESLTGKPFVRYWMHVGFVEVNREKMSKSLGNFFTIREVLGKVHPEVLRFFLIQSHYRSPLHYDEGSLQAAKSALDRLYGALRGVCAGGDPSRVPSLFKKRFQEALADDFNTPIALSVLFELTKEIFLLKEQNNSQVMHYAALLKTLAEPLGLLQREPEEYLQQGTQQGRKVDPLWVESQIVARKQARLDKNFALADTIRKSLLEQGVVLEDTAQGTIWRTL